MLMYIRTYIYTHSRYNRISYSKPVSEQHLLFSIGSRTRARLLLMKASNVENRHTLTSSQATHRHTHKSASRIWLRSLSRLASAHAPKSNNDLRVSLDVLGSGSGGSSPPKCVTLGVTPFQLAGIADVCVCGDVAALRMHVCVAAYVHV